VHRSRRSLRPALAAATAALVLAACGGGDGATATAAPAPEGAVSVVGTDTLTWEPTDLQAEVGEVTIALTCQKGVAHDLVIEESGTKVAECNAGGSDTGTVDLDAGEYTFYCSLPGHRRAGMEGTLTVS
jgi:plastocyanin